MNSGSLLILLAPTIGAWRLSRLFRLRKADLLFGSKSAPSSVGKEHPLFWLNALLLIALTAGGLLLAFHFWGMEQVS